MSKIQYKVGNLIEALRDGEVEYLVHQCNCFCAMGAGIALQLAKRWPEVREADNRTARGDKNKMGTFGLVPVGHQKVVVNLYGQYGASASEIQTDYTSLREGLQRFNNLMWTIHEHRPVVGIPLIGAGLGGGDWGVISKIIEEELIGCDVRCFVLDEGDIPNEDWI